MNVTGWAAGLRDFYLNDPMTAAAFTAALVALATTPLAFAVIGRSKWFEARRGRVTRRPEFASVVAGMMLVMGIPAIFAALVVKSRHFDKDRYEFDPNKTWSVLEQGRGYKDLKEADEAVRAEMKRLEKERKDLVNSVKKLDESMLALRAASGSSPAVAKTMPGVLERLAKVRQSVGVDGPQQLMDFTAPPAEIASAVAATAAATPPAGDFAMSTRQADAVRSAPAAQTAAADAGTGAGLPRAAADAEVAAAPEPQKSIAAMLPLTDLPAGWAVGKSGDRYVETFNAENLFEKIDGRAESFVDFKVKGMAYTFYHPVGDESNEVQVYIFELGDALKALGKYGTEKPDEAKPLDVGAEGYTTAGSTLFYSGPYYTQIVSTKDDAKFAEFAVALARRIAAAQKAPAPRVASSDRATGEAAGGRGEAQSRPPAKDGGKPSADAPATPEALFALLPAGSGRTNPNYVPADVFGYSFLSDVFMAEYSEGGATWKAFIRPYPTPEEAKAVFDKYIASAKQDGAEVKDEKVEGAERFVVSASIGLYDAVFLKGNTFGGVAGSTEAKPAEAFARTLAKSLPDRAPVIAAGK